MADLDYEKIYKDSESELETLKLDKRDLTNSIKDITDKLGIKPTKEEITAKLGTLKTAKAKAEKDLTSLLDSLDKLKEVPVTKEQEASELDFEERASVSPDIEDSETSVDEFDD